MEVVTEIERKKNRVALISMKDVNNHLSPAKLI